MRLRLPRNTERGFTLIELLVVAPVAILAIAGLISLMVALIGDISASRERSVSSYDVQDALDRIEQDARIATTFMPTFSLITSPQGRNNTTGQFTTTSGDIIMSQYATTASPYDATRKVVYYADQPYACNSSTYTLNRPMTVRVIYFTTTSGSNTTLWRRTILPSWSTTASGTTKVCNTPWQRDSCAAAVMPNANCQAQDEKMLDYVSTFSTTYYTDAGTTTTNARLAASLKVSLTQTKQVAGESLATNGVTRASHINVTTDDIPTAPSVSVYNPAINTYNNPVLTTFGWDAVKNAAVYSVRYQINGGAWQNQPDQTGTQFQVTDARPLDTITIRVASKSDMGASAETAYSYQTPLWTYANLENDWDCYQPTESQYPCPAYTLSKSGLVLVRGLAAHGATDTVLFTLPAGLRPHQQNMYAVSANDDLGRMDVRKDGTVYMDSGSASIYVALSSLRFIAEGTPGITWNNAGIATWNNWTNYTPGGGVWGVPSYTQDSSGRVTVIGIITWNGTTASDCAGCDYLNPGIGSINTGIFPTLSAPNAFSAFQVTSEPRVEARALGNTTSWNFMNAMYYPTGTTVPQYNISLTSPWVTYSTSYNSPQYAKGSDGVVTLKGLIKSGSTARYAVIGTLPAGYRPGKQESFTTVGVHSPAGYADQTFARLDVLPDGRIMLYNTDTLVNNWLSLENIHFYQEN